tara:strand:+ start:1915 stop:2484 length:570 start_codon:yes stop_codon:yes gene_type:complete
MKNKGGNQAKKKGRKNIQRKTYSLDDLIKGPGEDYAYVQDKFGDGRFRVICYDKVTRLGIVRGKIKNSCRMLKGSLALVSIREYEDTKCDIIYEYLPDDIDKLLKNNIISESFVKTGTMLSNNNDNNYDDIKFTEETIEDDQKSQNSDTWESDDENIVNTDHTIKKNNIKDFMNIDSESDNEQLDIDDI